MENYLKFTTPDNIDIGMSIIWMCVSVMLIAIILFTLWKLDKPRNIYPNLATAFGIIGFIMLPVIFFGGTHLNNTRMVESLENNYGIEVLSFEGNQYLINVDGSIHPCSIHLWEETSYYTLCQVNGGRLLLNEVTQEKRETPATTVEAGS